MKLLLQRVSHARVEIEKKSVGQIEQGLCVFVGFERNDDDAILTRLASKLCRYRVFSDKQGKMNLSVQDVQGGLLLVPQFTLVADTKSGNRPGFSKGALPKQGAELFEQFSAYCRLQMPRVATGEFGADMQVHLCNDGPITFLLQA